MHIARVVVSAMSGGGGKTLLSLGLCRAISRQGFKVKPCKKGPDYIDAAWLARACGRPATNLDPFFLDADALRQLFIATSTGVDIVLVEGNRGLFDGLDVQGSCSTAELARILASPVILTVNCSKVTRTVAALVQGICHFEDGINVAGVVLNAVGSGRHASLVRQAIEYHTDVPVLGVLPRMNKNPLPERHMGIASCGRGLAEDVDATLDSLASFVSDNVDITRVLELARNAPDLPISQAVAPVKANPQSPRPRIGYVRDSAFWFYYEENLQALRDAGAELVALQILDGADDQAQWAGLHGLYLGGGFPEDHAAALSASPFLREIRQMALMGMPIYAECGGFMLLAANLEVGGQSWPMAGLFPVTVTWSSRPQGLGYVEGQVVAQNPFFPQGQQLRGHEFHYSRVQGQVQGALLLSRGTGMGAGQDGLVLHNVWASYTHIFAPAVPVWAINFVAAAKAFAASGPTPLKNTG